MSKWPETEGPISGIDAEEAQIVSALDNQVGGSHYKDLVIQPAEYSEKNKLSYLEGSVVKYVTRWRLKGGIQDLEKAIHCIELIIELEGFSEAKQASR